MCGVNRGDQQGLVPFARSSLQLFKPGARRRGAGTLTDPISGVR